jgi:hypothetical protein
MTDRADDAGAVFHEAAETVRAHGEDDHADAVLAVAQMIERDPTDEDRPRFEGQEMGPGTRRGRATLARRACQRK